MLLTVENTQHLTSSEFIEQLSIELFNSDNLYLINEPKQTSVPNYFYIAAYLLEFETEFQMSGLVTLLSNSTACNFENTLNSFKEINSKHFIKCLEGIISTLERYEMTPIKMRERFIDNTLDMAEHSIITMEKVHNDDELLEALSVYEDELFDTYPQIWDDLEKYLIEIRGK